MSMSGTFMQMMMMGAMTGANIYVDPNTLREQMRDKRDRLSRDIGLFGEIVTDGVFLVLQAPRISADDLKKVTDAADQSVEKKDLAALTSALSEVTAQQTERQVWRSLIGRSVKLIGERITYWVMNDSDINMYAAMAQMMNQRSQQIQTAQAVNQALPAALSNAGAAPRYDSPPGSARPQVNVSTRPAGSAPAPRYMGGGAQPAFRLGAPPARANEGEEVVLTFG